MEFNMTKVVEKIVMQAKENQEEFIIETIYPYCANILQMKINKEELKQILLNGIQKQQSCEDCISRKAVLEVQIKYAEHMEATKYWQMRDDIKALPPVTPTRPTGYWIFTTEGNTDHITCSVCDRDSISNFDYCPNCGAKMIESEE